MKILLTALLLSLPALPARTQTMPDIGPTPIPFYSGNLSVDPFMYYWGTRKEPPGPTLTPEQVAQLKRISCFAMCDYLAWPLIEKEPGRWDFSLYRGNAEGLRQAGIQYNVFCWLHFPPKWFLDRPEFVPYRCVEHDQPLRQMSLWSPATRRIYQAFYPRLAKALGDRIAFLRLAMPSEYGEIGYPVGMTNWLVPQEHVHAGFWCGDPEARKAFRAYALRRYRSVAGVNAAWGTRFGAPEEIAYPPVSAEAVALFRQPGQTAGRRWWLDFMDWYQQSWTDFMVWSAGVAKRAFPGFGLPQPGKDLRERREIIISLGYGGETPAFGNDQGRHIRAMKRAGLSAQTPGDIGYIATRRVSSACAFHGVPYYTEPPGDVNRDREVSRLWMDASHGAQVYFDYPQNLDGARDLFARYKEHLTGRRSLTEIGLLLPTTTHYLHPDWGWPPHLLGFADRLRDRLDYEVLDEWMVGGGALAKMGVRVLVVSDAEYLRPETLRALEAWVRRGGVLVSLQETPVRAVDGSEGAWRRLAPARLPVYKAGTPYPQAKALWKERGRKVGAGYVVVLPGEAAQLRAQAEFVAALHAKLSEFLPGARNGRVVDDAFDGVLASLFTDRILYYNPTDRSIAKEVTLRAADFGRDGVGAPEALAIRLVVPAHGIAAVRLKTPADAATAGPSGAGG